MGTGILQPIALRLMCDAAYVSPMRLELYEAIVEVGNNRSRTADSLSRSCEVPPLPSSVLPFRPAVDQGDAFEGVIASLC
jgi:hypothetical protein